MNRRRGRRSGPRSAGAQQYADGQSSSNKWSSTDGPGENLELRNDNYNGRRKSQGKTEMIWKRAQQVPLNDSAGQGSSPTNGRDEADSKASSLELNPQAETAGSDLMQSEESDLSVGYTEKGSGCSANRSPRENFGKPHANSSVLDGRPTQRSERRFGAKQVGHEGRESSLSISRDGTEGDSLPLRGKSVASSQRNPRPVCHRHTSKHSDTGWVDVVLVPLGSSKPSESVGGSKNPKEGNSSQPSECSDDGPFDICPPKSGSNVVLNENLFVTNKEKRAGEPKRTLIRSGMVLLKKFISLKEQENLVKECREFGLAEGFYQPGYRDGGKLNLRMMCLGKFWDCETKSYCNNRPYDGVKPPPIPKDFIELVDRSIKESHDLIIAEECGSSVRPEDILPSMSPDICLVNFYTASGRLGLHQDCDESKESLRKGLPVVSISIGDSAEFMYGDERDVDKAEKITLESGDVLIFGGESRHVFHGISSVKLNTAPKELLKDSNLRPGRLNLTFRQNYY